MQIKHINKAYNDGTGYVLNLSTPQVKHIVSGGFLPALGLALLGGVASALGGFATNKIIDKFSGRGFGESYIQNASAIGKGVLIQPMPKINYKKPISKSAIQAQKKGGMYQSNPSYGMGLGFQGSGLFQYGQPTTRGAGMVPL